MCQSPAAARRARAAALAASLVVAAAGGSAAQTVADAASLPAAVTDVELIPGWRRDDGAHVAAIAIRLAPGWRTYWRAPGLNGVPPQFDWSGSTNLAAVSYEWPAPIVFDSYGEATPGYEQALVLPVILTPARAEAPVGAAVDLFFGVCNEICIPAETRLAARLDPLAPPQGKAEIERALADRPLDARAGGVAAARCGLAPAEGGRRLTAEITLDAPPGPGLVTVMEAPSRPDLWIGPARTRVDGRRIQVAAPLEAPGGLVALDREGLRLTLLGDGRAIDIRGCSG